MAPPVRLTKGKIKRGVKRGGVRGRIKFNFPRFEEKHLRIKMICKFLLSVKKEFTKL